MTDTARILARLAAFAAEGEIQWPDGEGVKTQGERASGWRGPTIAGAYLEVGVVGKLLAEDWDQFRPWYPDKSDEQLRAARDYYRAHADLFQAHIWRDADYDDSYLTEGNRERLQADLRRVLAERDALVIALADAETRAVRDAARLADHLALLNLEEAVRCMMTHRNWRECAKVPNALANLDRQRAATPRPDAGLCAVCGGTRTVRSRYTLLGGQVIEQDEPCGDCAPRPDAGQGVG